MRTLTLFHALLLMAGGLMAGCSQTDPYTRPGDWRPLGANSDNLRAMVADPRDLYVGRGASVSPGDLAANAVERLRQDAVKPLPSSSIAEVKANDAGAAAPAAPAATPAAAAGGGGGL